MKLLLGFVNLIVLAWLLACNSSQEPTSTLSSTSEMRDNVPMVEVLEGEFIMGTSVEDVPKFAWEYYEAGGRYMYAYQNEKPELLVTLPTFFIDQLEVTNARYRKCATIGPCPPLTETPEYGQSYKDLPRGYTSEATYDDHPARVTGQAAQVYCEWVGKRLPTEAEWEKAARGTDGRLYPWGDEWDPNNISQGIEPVGSHPKDTSIYGVLDMAGNITEWTGSEYGLYAGPEYYSPNFIAELPREPIHWVGKGGFGPATVGVQQRMATRGYLDPTDNNIMAGFRCVSGPEPLSLDKALLRILDANPTPSLIQ